jgi:hypothetical protein
MSVPSVKEPSEKSSSVGVLLTMLMAPPVEPRPP